MWDCFYSYVFLGKLKLYEQKKDHCCHKTGRHIHLRSKLLSWWIANCKEESVIKPHVAINGSFSLDYIQYSDFADTLCTSSTCVSLSGKAKSNILTCE